MNSNTLKTLETHIHELRSIADTLRGRGNKFQIKRADELSSRADSAEVYMILRNRYGK